MTRFIDPVEHVKRTGDASLGVVSQRDIVQRQDQAARLDAQSDRTQRLIVFETIEYVLYDVPANTDFAMHHMFAASASAIGLNNMSIDIGGQCRVVALRIMSNAAVTAGTCTPFLQVTEGSDVTEYVFSECELSTSETRRKSIVIDWPQAVQIAKNATFLIALRTSAAFAPTTLDMKAHLTLGIEQWVPS